MKVTLSWHVPSLSKQLYSLLFQAQASVYAPLDLIVHPSAKAYPQDHGQALHFAQGMNGTDLSFTIKQQGRSVLF
jgi:hypothetical protein